MANFQKEWTQKASIDYFAPFVSLWLACNSWYKSHYSDITSGKDRDFINKIKTDYSRRNHLYSKFKDLIQDSSKEGIYFRNNIEQLHYALSNSNLQPERIQSCSLMSAVLDYSNPTQTTNLIVQPRKTQTGEVFAADVPLVIKLDQIYISSNMENVFTGLFEIIYQVRNILIHGNMEPQQNNHNVVKFCYLILWDLIN